MKFHRVSLLFLLFILLSDYTFSQVQSKQKADNILTGSNQGKEFWFSPILFYTDTYYGRKGYKIFAMSKTKTKATLEIRDYKSEIEIDPGKPGIWELSDTTAQAMLSYYTDSTTYNFKFQHFMTNIPSQSFENSAIHITSDSSITILVLLFYPYVSDATTLIPSDKLGNEYHITSYETVPYDFPMGRFPSNAIITATQDSTIVKIRLGGNKRTSITLYDSTRYFSPDSFYVNLNKGDVFYLQTDNKDTVQDLSGSIITSNHPVAVISGSMCANVPIREGTCNCIFEMDAPTKYWGKEFLIPTFANRKFNGIVRIYAQEPDTKIYRDGKLFDSIPYYYKNPASSFIERRIYPKKDAFGKIIPVKNVVISSNKKININYLNPGFADEYEQNIKLDSLNDPFSVEIVPVEQFSNSADIVLPTDKDSVFFVENYANIIFETDTNYVIPDDMAISRYDNNILITEKLSDYFIGIIEKYPISINDKLYNKITINLKNSLDFSINSSKTKFIVYGYGYNYWDAYAYSTGREDKEEEIIIPPAEPEDSIPPFLTGDLDCYGNLSHGLIRDSVINTKSKIKSIELDSANSFNYSLTYLPDSLNVDSVYFNLSVTDPNKDARAVIKITDYNGNDTTFTFNYTANLDKILVVYPVPSKDKFVYVKLFTCTESSAKMVIWDYIGCRCKVFDNIPLIQGFNIIPLDLREFAFSAYFLVIERPLPRSIHKIMLVD
jgi:hypothetical protein